MDYSVRIISKRWPNHSDHSGYDQIVRWLGTTIEPLDLTTVRSTWIPGRLAVWFAAKSGVDHYSYRAFFDEWAAARSMLRCPNKTVYHILYADDSYRYLGSLKRLLSTPIVATFHLPPKILKKHLHNVNHLRKLDALIVVGKNQIEFFDSLVGSDRVFCVPHGVDTTVFCPTNSRRTRTSRVCLFVGMYLRDFKILRQVIELSGASHRSLKFIVVTDQTNFSIFKGLENIELRCNVSEAELIELYQSSDLLLQPLQDSTANNSILEGLACGLPVVATEIGGVRDYLDETCGILVPPHDAAAMLDAALTLLSDDTMRCQMADNARARALEFDWSVVSEEMHRVYAQVLAK